MHRFLMLLVINFAMVYVLASYVLLSFEKANC